MTDHGQQQWVHFLSIPPGFANPDHQAVQDLYRGLGNNTGNMLFVNGLLRQVVSEEQTFGYKIPTREGDVQPDLVVIPAANWLNPRMDMGWMAEILQKFKGPCLMVGLGAQSETHEELPEIPQGTLDFLAEVYKRSNSISVRGNYSAQVMEHLGFQNTVVTGCPSLYWHCRPDFPALREIRSFEPTQVLLQSTRHRILPDKQYREGIDKMLKELMLFALRHGHPQVFQSEFEEMYISLGRENNRDVMLDIRPKLEGFYGVTLEDGLRQYLRDRGHVFFNIEAWSDFVMGMQLTCSARLHGCIMSMISGTPAIMIYHDSRTQEVADFAGIPSISLPQFFEASSIEEISNQVTHEPFFDKYAVNYPNYKSFLEDNGVLHRLA